MTIYRYTRKHIRLLAAVEVVFILYIAATFFCNSYYSRLYVITAAVLLFCYIIVLSSTTYTISQDSLAFKTILRKAEFMWGDIYSIENLVPALKANEKLSIAVYSRKQKKEIPITSNVENYEFLISRVLENVINNDGIKIPRELLQRFNVEQ